MSKPTAHIFGIGINKYSPLSITSIPKLRGCVNDVNEFTLCVKKFIKGYEIEQKILLNENATRKAVIDHFEYIINKANKNDLVIIYYSGHGSQEEAEEIFSKIEPSKRNQTLVLYDSREPNNFDLADKELAYLIAQISAKEAQIILILDSCHSGGGDRNEQKQQFTTIRSLSNSKKRSLDDYIFPRELAPNLPQGNYVFFSGCQTHQVAEEIKLNNGEYRGAFTYYLTETLTKTTKLFTYRDLFKTVSRQVKANTKTSQIPELKSTGFPHPNQLFLSNTIVQSSLYFTLAYYQKDIWFIDGGAIYGIPVITGTEKTRLAIFRFEDEYTDLKTAIATGEIIEVMQDISKVNIGIENEKLDEKLTYIAVIIDCNLPRIKVYFKGDQSQINLVSEFLKKSILNAKSSLYISEVEKVEEADFIVLAEQGKYLIKDGHKNLNIPINPLTSEQEIIEILEHIAKWENMVNLINNHSNQIPSDAVSMHIYQDDVEINDSEINLHYQTGDIPPSIKIKLKNNSDKSVYCVLLNLTQSYGIKASLLTSIWLQSGEEIWCLEGKDMPVKVPNKIAEQGIKNYGYIVKLIVSSSQIDSILLEQDDLPLLQKRDRSSEEQNPVDVIKGIKAKKEACFENCWLTKEVKINTTRPIIIKSKTEEPIAISENSRQLAPPSESNLSKLPIKIIIVGVMTLLSVSIFWYWHELRRDKSTQPDVNLIK